MEYFITTPDINEKPLQIEFFNFMKTISESRDGFFYYKYPLAGGIDNHLADFTLVDAEYGIVSFDVENYTDSLIRDVSEFTWNIGGEEYDSPLLKLDDYSENLKAKFQKYRELRNKVRTNYFLILPSINEEDFEKYGDVNNILFSNYKNMRYDDFWKTKSSFKGLISRYFKSIAQGAGPLNSTKNLFEIKPVGKIGAAIDSLDAKIAEFERTQHAAAIQIPNGPQSIRGMAGTGKTIILAMKAAILHSRYPQKKILYTFNTQSLYNQVKNLITKFYRDTQPKDPNWENLLILHAWGGATKEGVYYRTCLRNSITPFKYGDLQFNYEDGFDFACKQLLQNEISEEFDFILMDEAQDLPESFYKLIYKICKNPKIITFAYDELQSLNKITEKNFSILFGNENGSNIDLNGYYPNEIKKQYTLKVSYRNPLDVLMVAHGIGLGLHNKNKEMQIIDEKETWENIGYRVVSGELKKGQEVIIERPFENSISFVREIYNGDRPSVETIVFEDENHEMNWIVKNIKNDIEVEEVKPHNILIITLDTTRMKNIFLNLQRKMSQYGIPSLIPGIDAERDKFAEYGFVTLSTVYKAKGNEAFIVYIMNFEKLYSYSDFINSRNKAFTSISRSKGWCRITGVGKSMERAANEISTILNEVPRFKFEFPDVKNIRRMLSKQETTKRKKEVDQAFNSINNLLTTNERALDEIPEEIKKELLKKLLSDLE